MALRASGRRLGKSASRKGMNRKPEARLARAAVHVVEALENRRMLTSSPGQLAYDWDHMPDVIRHDLAVYEYIDPVFQVRLDAQLAEYGLQPIAPEAGTLSWDTNADGRARISGNHHGRRPQQGP